MNKYKIGIGIEIECIYNQRILNIKKGDYHNGIKNLNLKGWKIENDGSLHIDKTINPNFSEGWKDSVEFVMCFSKSKKTFFKRLNNFINFISSNYQYQLNEVIDFNKSCGSHVHMSIINKSFRFEKKVLTDIYFKARNKFFDLMKKSNINSKMDILKHYDRSYASIIGNNNYWKTERYSEFNLTSEQENKGLEWRSLNMLNIKTWDEFKEFWNIVYECVKYLCRISQHYTVTNKINLLENYEIINLLEKLNTTDFNFNINKPKIKRTSSFKINSVYNKFEDEVLICVT